MNPANRCEAPVARETIVDYWAGDLSVLEEGRVEEHVFGCDACARTLQRWGALVRGIAAVVGRRGGLTLFLTPSLLNHLEAQGLRLNQYRLEPGGFTACAARADDDVIVSSFGANFDGVERVDLCICGAEGEPVQRIEDVPVDRSNGQVIYALAADDVRTWPSMTIRARLVAVDPGGERLLGEYTLAHAGFRSAR